MVKLILGLLIVGAIAVLVQEYRKAAKKEEANEDLHEELDDVKAELRKVDIKEDVVDAKVKLKGRQETVDKKAKVLDPDKKKAGK